MNTYSMKYILADDESQKEIPFDAEAEDIDTAIGILVKSFGKDYNPANIDFTLVTANDIDLGENGIYDAEIALARHYS